MLFNSYAFIFVLLPVALFGYKALLLRQDNLAKLWLFCCSMFFYAWWELSYLPLLLGSITINYLLGRWVGSGAEQGWRRLLLLLGIVFNVGLLGYFKYTDFLIDNVNALFGGGVPHQNIILPLAISFFTFQQIAYLVDSYRHEVDDTGPLNYAVFVCFFPQLIAGPIVHHREMMPQFNRQGLSSEAQKNIGLGLSVFALGLFKKVVVADHFAISANYGFDVATDLTLLGAWVTSLSYTLQLYFDFSGYTDMAIGSALLFNIKLPMNFDSPYKAVNIQDFWRRWHMTLSRFLRDYIYIPLGGNRFGSFRLYRNVFLTFLIGGIWHGAAWTFVIWGALHGLATCVHRVWSRFDFVMPRWLAWFITFNFVNIAWVWFRATDMLSALKVLTGMMGVNGLYAKEKMAQLATLYQSDKVDWWYMFYEVGGDLATPVWLIGGLMVCFAMKNSLELVQEMPKRRVVALFVGGLLGISLVLQSKESEFLYFNF